MENFKKTSSETDDQYIHRICAMKESANMTWKQVAEVINNALGQNYGESCYRKQYQMFQKGLQVNEKQIFAEDEYLNSIRAERRELEKEKIKMRDERIDYQKSIREEARKESFIELVERTMSKYIEPFDYVPSPVLYSNKDMIACLSDLHAGIEVDNWLNQYNSGILKTRLQRYADEIIEVQAEQKCQECHIVLGGDNISGLIHSNLRLQQNENVIEQVKIVAIYVGEFIKSLRGKFNKIIVHSVSGNHSRLSPNKNEHLKGEELDGLVTFCLGLMFAGHDNVIINEDASIDSTIDSFRTRGGHLFYSVHGDKDSETNVVKNLTLMTGVKPAGIIMGHRHHNAYDTEHSVKIIQCGSVVGADDYCVDKRISGEPEQCIVITTAERAVRCFYDIGLK